MFDQEVLIYYIPALVDKFEQQYVVVYSTKCLLSHISQTGQKWKAHFAFEISTV